MPVDRLNRRAGDRRDQLIVSIIEPSSQTSGRIKINSRPESIAFWKYGTRISGIGISLSCSVLVVSAARCPYSDHSGTNLPMRIFSAYDYPIGNRIRANDLINARLNPLPWIVHVSLQMGGNLGHEITTGEIQKHRVSCRMIVDSFPFHPFLISRFYLIPLVDGPAFVRMMDQCEIA